MYGTATGIRDISDLVEQQKQGKQPAAVSVMALVTLLFSGTKHISHFFVVQWISGSTATLDFVQSSFPDLKIKPFFGSRDELDLEMDKGNCEIFIFDAPLVAHDVLRRFQRGQCMANGKVRLAERITITACYASLRATLLCDLPYETFFILNLLLLVAVGTACWIDWRTNGLWSVALRNRC
jgi:hypothetical protein